MSEFVFLDKQSVPTVNDVKSVLKSSYEYWEEIRDFVETNYGDVTPDWKFYTKKSGWTLKTLLKKRNLFFLTPLEGRFYIGFVFGDKAMRVIEESEVCENFKKSLREAKKYAEGRGIRIEVASPDVINDIHLLIDIKINVN